MTVSNIHISSMLDEMAIQFMNKPDNCDEILVSFSQKLMEIKRAIPFHEWKDVVAPAFLKHPLQQILLQDPFTKRAFHKPRGYAGDAVMMDLLYAGDGSVSPALEGTETAIGTQLYRSVMKLSTAEGVRNRKYAIAKRLDEIAAQKENPDVLAVACGHLREANHSVALQNGKVGKYFALDSDPLSIECVHNEMGARGVTAMEGSVLDILRERIDFPSFDFIYSAGLYDYLQDKVAKRLTEKLFQMLKPGGVLLIANFLADHLCAAYIEACCDWWLVYRDHSEMKQLLTGISLEQIGSVKSFTDETGSIVYLEVTRR